MHDLHATILHLLGLDHERLTYRYAGRDFRLTDVARPGRAGDYLLSARRPVGRCDREVVRPLDRTAGMDFQKPGVALRSFP